MHIPRWALLLAVLGALAGCGNSDDDNEAGSPERQTTTAAQAPAPSSDKPAADKRAKREPAEIAPNDVVTKLLRGDRLAPGVSFDEGSDEDQIATVVDTLYDAFADGREKRFCDQVSEAARRQMAKEVGGNTGPNVVCLQTFDSLVMKAGKLKQLNPTLRARIVDVEVDGDEATAKVDFAGKPGSVPLVKEDDRWKLAPDPGGG